MLGSFCNQIFSFNARKFFYLRISFIVGPLGSIFLFLVGYLRGFWRHSLHSRFSLASYRQFIKLYVQLFQEIPFGFFNVNEGLSYPRLLLFFGSLTYCPQDLRHVWTKLKERHCIVFVTGLMYIVLMSITVNFTILIIPHLDVKLHCTLVCFLSYHYWTICTHHSHFIHHQLHFTSMYPLIKLPPLLHFRLVFVVLSRKDPYALFHFP